MGVYIWNRLPSEYQEVEWIQSSGSQHINTGYIPNYNTKIACKFNHDNNSTDQSIFGARGNNNANEYTLWSTPTVNTSTSVAIFNKTSGSNLTKYAYNTDIEFEYDKSGWKYGTQSGTWSPSSGTPNLDLFIFTINTNGTADSRKFKGKLYYFKIRDNGTLVRNFIPCYRKSDSVIGMYDLVNNQFYTNSGTGTFSKGSDVNNYYEKEMKNAYIGEVWTPGSNTIAYFPFDNNQLDEMGNYTLSASGTKKEIGFEFSSSSTIPFSAQTIKQERFRSMWVQVKTSTTYMIGWTNVGGFRFNYNHSNSSLRRTFMGVNSSSSFLNSSQQSFSENTWYHIAWGWDSSNNYKAYINNTLVRSGTATPKIYNQCGNLIGDGGDVIFSDLIIESTPRTDEARTHYYNLTKSNYGL